MRSCFKILIVVVSVWVSSASAYATPVTATEEMSIAVGENRTLPADDVKSYSEGTPGMAEVRVTPNGRQFIVVGKQPGTTTLLLIKKDGSELTWKINVFARAVQSVEEELAQLLGDTMGVRTRRVGARFFIEGGVSTEAELDRIQHIASLYQGQVESLVVLGGAAADRKINVRVDVYFVQYEKAKLLRAGIEWPSVIGGAQVLTSNFAFNFLSNTVTQATAQVANQPLPQLDLASSKGYAKVLKHASVIAANGSEAAFTNGGSQNYPISAGFTASIQRISFGTDIKVLPRFDPTSREIEVKVNVDVSDLLPPAGGTSLPGQSTSTLTTLVSLKLGESLVLSGIHTESKRNSTSGLPYLSEIPILGLLFGAKNIEENQVEGAIFVVPGVVESVPQQASELISSALHEYKNYDGDMEDVHPSERVPGFSGAASTRTGR